MKRHLFIVICTLCITLYYTLCKIDSLQSEYNRLKQNQSHYFDSLEYYRTESGQWAASTKILQLRCNELESLLTKRNSVINSLKIKLRRVEQLSTTVQETHLKIKTIVQHDTILHRDTPHNFHWHNAWNHIQGKIIDDSIICTLSVKDTLYQIVHRIPRRFLFLRFGTKFLKQEVISSNPNCHIVWSEHIKIRKSRHKK